MHDLSISAYAYPWDVVGDPAAAGRIADLGVDNVTLAASYHSVRAATPRHPSHRVVDARTSAVYVPIRRAAWADRRLTPVEGAEWAGPNAFGRARHALAAAGLSTRAWIVVAHSSAMGERAPDLCVVNAFGDRYRYALCPSSDEVLDYAVTLTSETTAAAAVDSVVLEAVNALGLAHQSAHDKTAGAHWTPAEVALLSLCFCAACHGRYAAAGIDADDLAWRIRSYKRTLETTIADVLGDLELAVRAIRLARLAELQSAVVAAARAHGAKRVAMHGADDPWSFGPSAPIPDVDTSVDSWMAHCWEGGHPAVDRLAAVVSRTRRHPGTASGAYVSVLGTTPSTATSLAAEWHALRAAGARELHVYHAGLASTERLGQVRDAINLMTNGTSPRP